MSKELYVLDIEVISALSLLTQLFLFKNCQILIEYVYILKN